MIRTQEQVGKGALRSTLLHYFVEDGAGDDFWTEDRAFYAPAGADPSPCLIDDDLSVVEGTGKFANASGHLHNRGLATFFETPGYGGVTIVGSLEVNLRGRVCGDGL